MTEKVIHSVVGEMECEEITVYKEKLIKCTIHFVDGSKEKYRLPRNSFDYSDGVFTVEYMDCEIAYPLANIKQIVLTEVE